MQINSLAQEDVSSSLSSAFSKLIDKNAGITGYRILNLPPAGRGEAMAAFTALADDVTFLEYNAAAGCVLKNSEIGIFHNSLVADSSMDSIAYTFQKNNFGFGFGIKCFYVEFIERNFFEDTAKNYYSETEGIVNFSYNFFTSYDLKAVALGVNLKSAYRNMPDYTSNIDSKIIVGSGLSQSGVAFMADLALQLKMNFCKFYKSREPNFQVGIAACNFGAGITNLGSPNGVKLDDPLPSKFSFGISYKPINFLTLAVEFQQPLNILNPLLSEKWSVGTGFSVQCTGFFAFQGGFLLKGANPRFSLGAEFFVKKFIMNLNYSFDFTSSKNPVNRINVSAKINLGDGGREKIQEKIDELYIEGLKKYTDGDMKEAIRFWTQIVGGKDLDGQEYKTLDKNYQPARKGLSAAKETLSLQVKIKHASFLN